LDQCRSRPEPSRDKTVERTQLLPLPGESHGTGTSSMTDRCMNPSSPSPSHQRPTTLVLLSFASVYSGGILSSRLHSAPSSAVSSSSSMPEDPLGTTSGSPVSSASVLVSEAACSGSSSEGKSKRQYTFADRSVLLLYCLWPLRACTPGIYSTYV
jgi:hypothetical protein